MTTMTDRCDCPYPDPMTYGGPNPLCPEHGDVDAILASGRHTDRKGRTWHRYPSPPDEMDDGWWAYGRPIPGRFEYASGATMRTLIERDLHRDECPGLKLCYNKRPRPTIKDVCPHTQRGITWAEGDTTCYVCETCEHEWTERD